MKKFKGIFLILAIVCSIVFCAWAVVRIVKAVQFDLNCEAYLKRAATANTVAMAKEELDTVIKYAKKNRLTDGTVSIFLKNPANSIKYWFEKITSAYDNLNKLPEDATQFEVSNVLMQMRDSLTDRDNGNTKVIVPDGITVYPNNVAYFWWAISSFIALCVFWTLFLASLDLDGNLKPRTKKNTTE